MPNQSFADFAREKTTLFDRWCAACKVDDIAALRELMLLEEFKNCVSDRLSVYLNEQKVSTLQQAAMLADEFRLTHKTTFVSCDPPSPREFSQDIDQRVQTVAGSGPKVNRPCFFCRKTGHLIADCVAWKRKQGLAPPQPKGVGLIKTSSIENIPVEPHECFKPFISDAFVSLTGDVKEQRRVTVLRDTAYSQSLILSSVLPGENQSSCNASAVVRGIEMGFVPAPLHRIHVESSLASGFFSVGVRSCFPIDGVDFIMGNDIAGGKVFPVPEVVNVPISGMENDDLAKSHPDIFSVSVLTRAQVRDCSLDVDLSDTLFASVVSEDRLPSVGASVNRPLKEAESVPQSVAPPVPLPLNGKALIDAQQKDPSLVKCLAADSSGHGKGKRGQFLFEDGVLMRR